jgi:hypothetical protein
MSELARDGWRVGRRACDRWEYAVAHASGGQRRSEGEAVCAACALLRVNRASWELSRHLAVGEVGNASSHTKPPDTSPASPHHVERAERRRNWVAPRGRLRRGMASLHCFSTRALTVAAGHEGAPARRTNRGRLGGAP